jgi:hypothetical protein
MLKKMNKKIIPLNKFLLFKMEICEVFMTLKLFYFSTFDRQ